VLGANFSRYIRHEDGRQLEVKRALSSRHLVNDQMTQGPASSVAACPELPHLPPFPVPAGHSTAPVATVASVAAASAAQGSGTSDEFLPEEQRAAPLRIPNEQTTPIQRLSPDLDVAQLGEVAESYDLPVSVQQSPSIRCLSPSFQGLEDSPVFPSHDRKIFVGGIPQETSQEDLFAMFSQFGAVKKAWLQREHRDSNSKLKHRGFGFVIFRDGDAVNHVLGANLSRYIRFEDGRQLEVKRALSSRYLGNDQMTQGPASSVAARPELPHLPPFPVLAERLEQNRDHIDGRRIAEQLPSGEVIAKMPYSSRKELECELLRAMPDHYDD